ncbi:MAG: hypothetical protein KC912_19860 [Proteobacteria bacterium]|nr:hypothetical protein [Pseudomonadota bacterium]
MRALPLLLIPVLGACKVVDAPENLEEILVFGFEHFDDGDEQLSVMFEELVPLVDAQGDALAEGYRIDSLDPEHLEAVGVEAPDVENVLGAAGQADYVHGLDDVLYGVTLPNKADHYDNYESYEVTEDTDLDCFLAGDCADYTMAVTQTVKVPILGSSTQQVDQVYRRVTTPDGDEFVISRVLSPDGVDFSGTLVEIDQQFQLFVMYPEGDGLRRVEAFWVEARVIGLDVPDSMAVNNFAGSVDDQAARVDEFLDSQ